MSSAIGSEGVGLYQMIQPVYLLAWSICASGFTTTVSRLTAQENARAQSGNMGRVLKQALCMSTAIGCVVGSFFFLYADFLADSVLHDARSALSFRILAFAIPFMSASSCIRGYFLGLQQSLVPAFSQVLEQSIRIGCICLLTGFFVPMGLAYACAAAVLGIFFGEFTSFCFVFFSYLRFKRKRKYIKRPTIAPYAAAHLILSMALPLSATRVSSSLLSATENILIPQKLQAYGLSSAEAMATFGHLSGMAMPLVMLPSALLSAISVSLVPEISEACAVRQESRIQKTVSAAVLFTCVIGIGSAMIFMLFPEQISSFIYGSSDIAPYLMILSFLCPFFYLQMTLGGLLNGLGEHVFLFFCHIASSLLSIAVLLIFVPQYGLPAYFAGWFGSLLLSVAASFIRLYQRCGVSFRIKQHFILPALSAAAAALTTKELIPYAQTTGGFLFCAALSGALYLFFLTAIGCFSKVQEEILRFFPTLNKH